MKDRAKLIINIKITTKNGVISVHTCGETKKLVLAMSTNEAHIITGHHYEEQTHKIALDLGWSLKRDQSCCVSLVQ